jgi:hypothetical protein
MKKLLLFMLLLMGGGNFVFGQNQIPMHIIKEGSTGPDNPLAPPRPWYITQDENVLTIPAFEDDLTLQLRDEDDTVVYSTIISAGTTQVILPTTLSGDFELRLIPFFANYYYRGYLIL